MTNYYLLLIVQFVGLNATHLVLILLLAHNYHYLLLLTLLLYLQVVLECLPLEN
jgi:hypothetical protein